MLIAGILGGGIMGILYHSIFFPVHILYFFFYMQYYVYNSNFVTNLKQNTFSKMIFLEPIVLQFCPHQTSHTATLEIMPEN